MSNDLQATGGMGSAGIATPGPAAEPSEHSAALTVREASFTSEALADVCGPVGDPDALAPHEMRAWLAFLRAHAGVSRRLEADLLAAGGLPLAEYDVLVQLAAADERRLRMHELASRVLLSRAGITRLIDRLVADGLVERAKCGGDARGSYAVLTEAGLDRLRAAAPGHLEAVRRYFLEAFSEPELHTLAGLLERLPPAS